MRRLQKLIDELTDILRVNPRRAEAHVNLRGVQWNGLRGFKGLDVLLIFGVRGGVILSDKQLLTHVAGKILVCCLIDRLAILVPQRDTFNVRYAENLSFKLFDKFLLRPARQGHHVVHINAGFFRHGKQ